MARNRNRHGNRNRNRGGGATAKKLASLLDPKSTTTGKDLLKLARALTHTELRPQTRAYGRLAKELRGQETADVLGLRNLGQDVGSQIAGAYLGADQGGARATGTAGAIGQLLNQQTAGTQAAAAGQQQAAQTGQLGQLTEAMSLRGAPGGGAAQQELQNLVAAQGGRAAQETAGQGAFAGALGANYQGHAGMMRQATQMQGARAQSDVGRQIAARIAETRLTAGQDIREALGKRADVRALKGETMLKNISELRQQERDYALGKAATRTDRRGQRIDAQSEAARLAETQRHNQVSEGIAQQNADTSARGGGGNRAHDAEDRQQEHQEQQQRKQDKRAARQAAATIGSTQSIEYNQTNFAEFVAEIKTQTGVSYPIARAAAQRYINRHS